MPNYYQSQIVIIINLIRGANARDELSGY